MRIKTWLLFLVLLLCGLPGCSRAAAAPGQEEHQITDISSMKAETLSMAENIQETKTLKEDEYTLAKTEIISRHVESIEPGNHAILATVIRNTDSLFYQIEYSEDMAQYSYRNQLYMQSLKHGEAVLLYDTSDAHWLNSIYANDTYLYWVEYVSPTPSDLTNTYIRVMQCQLDNGKVSCIAERDGTEYFVICLEASDRFLTWYDIHMNDPKVELVIYDIERQTFQERANTDNDLTTPSVMLFNPYVGLNIVENHITYFMQDDQERLYIRRENLLTGATDTLLLGKIKPYEKMVACFSDSRYIGWYTESDYYFYDTDSEKLYLWNMKKDDVYIFSRYFCGGKLYFNNDANHYVYVWDLPTGQVRCQNFGEDAYWIRSYGDGNMLYLGTSSIDTAGCCALHGGD